MKTRSTVKPLISRCTIGPSANFPFRAVTAPRYSLIRPESSSNLQLWPAKSTLSVRAREKESTAYANYFITIRIPETNDRDTRLSFAGLSDLRAARQVHPHERPYVKHRPPRAEIYFRGRNANEINECRIQSVSRPCPYLAARTTKIVKREYE